VPESGFRQPLGLKPPHPERDRNSEQPGILVDLVGINKTMRVVQGIAVPAAEADVWTPALGATVYLDVEFELVNVDGTNDATASVGIDYANDGDASNRYFVRTVNVLAGEVGVRVGPYRIRGDDAIRAVANAASDVELQVYILEEGAVR
jgi:hypothetical protein